MKKHFIFAALLVFSLPLPSFAADTGDPNAALRKLTAGGQDKALADFERVKRLNNDAAIQHFNSLIAKNPKDAAAYAKRGKAYSANKDYPKALADYDQALKLDPKITEAYVGRAVAHFFTKDYDKSWQDVHQAEALGGEFWPSFMDALKSSSGREK